ncbi:MAG: helix-turn-helix transcriptional regulator [Clostridia bacterium]|nr:helix-turn-helix transcriptional regulator [Clostridia bacterium]
MILPEIISAGIYDSRFVVKNLKESAPRKTSFFEIELPLENGGVSYIDSGSALITPDILICTKPGQIRHTKFPYRCYYLHVKLEKGILYDIVSSWPCFVNTSKSDKYQETYSKIVRHYNSDNENEIIILQSLVLELIYTLQNDLAKNVSANSKKNSGYVTIKLACEYIKTHLSSELSLGNVSEVMHLSPVHFHNKFKSVTGKTLREYIENQRLKKSVELLLTTDYSLTQIAFECGFSSQSYFNYVFKKRMNKTPREYVKEFYSKYEA